MKTFRVGIIGATGMVGQRFLLLLADHPWFEVKVLAASARSAGKTYRQAVEGRWAMSVPVPEKYLDMPVQDAAQVEAISSQVDFVFCAVDMPKDKIRALEDAYASAECPVVSNNSAHRMTPDVPMLIPELNPEHLAILDVQKKRLGSKRGFVVVKPNCSIQAYVPALHPLRDFGLRQVAACTYQAISGAGKTFERWPEMVDNVIPYIGGEEEKSEQEPLKIWGRIENGGIVKAEVPLITTQTLRVPVTDGHMAAVYVKFDRTPSKEEILARWAAFPGSRSVLPSPTPLRSSSSTARRTTGRRPVWTGTATGVWL